MRIPRPTVVDFESFGIGDRPRYPPVPTSVSIKEFGRAPRYYAWGHASQNNCTWVDARNALEVAWRNPDGILCYHGKFDTDVGETHFGLPPLPWDKVHDAMFLAYLDSPDERDIGLKPTAARKLGHDANERDAVIDWLCARQPVPGIKLGESPQSKHPAMAYLPWAPGDLVGRYANGDTYRAEGLFKLLYPSIVERGMLAAYDRERRLMPHLLAAERRGLTVHLKKLEAHCELYSNVLARVDAYLARKLGDINLDSGAQLVDSLVTRGLADETKIGLTPGGALKSDKSTLLSCVREPALGAVLAYRAGLTTCLRTYMRPWLAMARETGGTIHTDFNQTMTDDGGTRTGRLSCTWFMNMPKEFEPLFSEHQEPGAKKKLPRCPLSALIPPLPRCRTYIAPRKGYVLIDRDYSQQEPRILAHFDGKLLMQAYLRDPWIDFHDYAKAELERSGLFYDRKPVKNTNLGLIYGMGTPLLAAKNDMAVEEAARLKKAVLALYPGLRDMYKDMKFRAANKEPIHTWGGREYYCEEPKIVKGRFMTFDYKMVNKLIQGSAADATKEGIIRYHEAKPDDDEFLLPVHDENLAQVPAGRRDKGMAILKEAMESVEFDVPLLSEGDWSPDSWGELRPYDKKGVRVNERSLR